MKCVLLLVSALYLSLQSSGQYSRHIVQFTDKKGTSAALSSPSTYLTQKAIERRNKQKINIDSTDLPVSRVYIDSLISVPNVTLVNSSKWLNQVLIQSSDSAALVRIRQFPFVRKANAVAPVARNNEEVIIQKKFSEESVTPLPPGEILNSIQRELKILDTLSYGSTFNQIHIHQGEYLHNLGFTGRDMIIAVLDAGFFGYKTNPSIDSARLQNRILGEFDFVENEQSVNEDHPHGLQCLSVIAANRPGIMIGSAPHAKFYLLRTEDASSEYPVEEQYWVVAAEFADSAGADMITSSVGYSDFDDPAFNHSYSERNGNTTMVTIGADLAAKKGMIVMNSAGNSGNLATDFKYVIAPADGDSVVAVGAVDVNGNIASFSSWGPNGAGKIKPDIVSVGQGTIISNNNGNPVGANGTSYSNPNVAGLIACLWQAFPEFTNMEIIDAVKRSADRFNNPDDRYGYGLPDFKKAYDLLSVERTMRNATTILGDNFIKAYPVPFKGVINVLFKAPASGKAVIRFISISGQVIETLNIAVSEGEIRVINFYSADRLPRGVYFISYEDQNRKEVLKVMK